MGTKTRSTRSGSNRSVAVSAPPPVSSYRNVTPVNFRKVQTPKFRPVRKARAQLLQKSQEHVVTNTPGDDQQMDVVKNTDSTTAIDTDTDTDTVRGHNLVMDRATTKRAIDVLRLEAVTPVILKSIAAGTMARYEAGEITSASNGMFKKISTSGYATSLDGAGYTVTIALNLGSVPEGVPVEGGWMYAREAWHMGHTFSRTTPQWMPLSELDARTQDTDTLIKEAHDQFITWKNETPKLMEWYRENTRCVETRPIVKHALDEVYAQTQRRQTGKKLDGGTVVWSSSLVVVPPQEPGTSSDRRSHVFSVIFVLPS